MAAPSFDSAPPELVDEIIRQAELRLDAQLSAALAADQRAMTFAGLLFAGVAVLLGGGLGISPGSPQTTPIFAMAIGFTLAAACACWSARPSPWHFAGNFPASWTDDVSNGLSLEESKREMASNFQELLEFNEAQLTSAARWMRASMIIALLTVIAGLAALLCSSGLGTATNAI